VRQILPGLLIGSKNVISQEDLFKKTFKAMEDCYQREYQYGGYDVKESLVVFSNVMSMLEQANESCDHPAIFASTVLDELVRYKEDISSEDAGEYAGGKGSVGTAAFEIATIIGEELKDEIDGLDD